MTARTEDPLFEAKMSLVYQIIDGGPNGRGEATLNEELYRRFLEVGLSRSEANRAMARLTEKGKLQAWLDDSEKAITMIAIG